MRKTVIGLIFVCFISVAIVTLCYAENCPSCGSMMIWTGETKTEWGKIFKLYKCPAGHSYWYPMSSPSSFSENNSSSSPSCPVCGSSAMWTGETYTEWGKLFKVYKCPTGHISVGQN